MLGALLLDARKVSEVAELVQPDDFYRGSHGKLFELIVAMDSAGRPVDPITVADEVDKRGLEEDIPRVRIHELAALVPATANVGHYARLVHEHAILRNLIRTGQEIARLGFERPGDLTELLAQAEGLLTSVTARSGREDAMRLDDSVQAAHTLLTEMVTSGKARQGISSGFYDVDALTTGFYPGQFILIAARPGMGKTVLGTNIAEGLADRGTPAAIFSLEMTKEELALRSLSRATGLSTQVLRTGKLTQEQYHRYRQASIRSDRPLYVDDRPMTIHEIRSRALRLRRKHDVELLVIDYLQLIVPPRIDSREQQIGVISRSLKALAKELRIPVVALSQLSRGVESRDNKRPQLADLRDSGSLEQDADQVFFIYRDEYYNADSEQKGLAELHLAKNRMGPSGVVRLKYAGERSAFLNLGRD